MTILFKIKENLKIILLSLLFIYILANLFGGQRGLFAYIEKKELLEKQGPEFDYYPLLGERPPPLDYRK